MHMSHSYTHHNPSYNKKEIRRQSGCQVPEISQWTYPKYPKYPSGNIPNIPVEGLTCYK